MIQGGDIIMRDAMPKGKQTLELSAKESRRGRDFRAGDEDFSGDGIPLGRCLFCRRGKELPSPNENQAVSSSQGNGGAKAASAPPLKSHLPT